MATLIVGGSRFPFPTPLIGGAGNSGTGRVNPNRPKNVKTGISGNAATEPRTATHWLVHWLTREPTVARYQLPVPLARVLAEHHAAVAAEPIPEANHADL